MRFVLVLMPPNWKTISLLAQMPTVNVRIGSLHHDKSEGRL
jgi:hypothetical protein